MSKYLDGFKINLSRTCNERERTRFTKIYFRKHENLEKYLNRFQRDLGNIYITNLAE